MGNYRSNRRRNRGGTRQRKKAAHGLDHLEERSQRKNSQVYVSIAKNYLEEAEIKGLERIVSMYLDYAESQAERQIPMKMTDWVKKLDAFLQFNEYDVLQNAGRVSYEIAKELAEQEYERFRVEQDRKFESDFDKEIKKLQHKKRS